MMKCLENSEIILKDKESDSRIFIFLAFVTRNLEVLD